MRRPHRTHPRALRLALAASALFVAVPNALARPAAQSAGSLSAPTGLSALTPTDTAPALSWNAVSGAAAYRVFRDGTRIARVSTPAYRDTSLTGSGSHDYTVRAISSAGVLSPFSVPATVLVDRTAPSAPGTPSAGGTVLAGPPSLSWAAASDGLSGVSSYRVVRDGDVVATVSGTAYTDFAVTDGSHVYTVRAIDAAGNTSASSGGASVTVDTAPPAPPAAPAASSPTRSAPALTWSPATDAGSGVVSYQVAREGSVRASVTGTSYTDSSINTPGSYSYTVRAVDAAGNVSPWSPAVTVLYGTPPSASAVSGVSARLSSPDIASQLRNHPTMRLVSPFFRWADLEPKVGSFDWSSLDADIALARQHDVRLIVRISAGADAPSWLFGSTASGGRPVGRLDLISTDPGSISGEISVPEPWDPDLLYHYRTLMAALQSNLGAYGDSSNTWRRADYVEFVPVVMPTEVGSEMPLAFGKGTYTGTYGGRTGTWDVHDTNQAEWYSAASGSTNAARLAWLQDSIGQAWKDAVSAQEAVLTSVPSAVAYGGILGDGMATARWIAANDVPQYGNRLWSMTTNLQPKVYADGTLGPYSAWDSAFAGVIQLAASKGGIVGFQAAGPKLLSTCNRVAYSVNDAMSTYHPLFYEAAPSQISTCSGFLLDDPGNLQARLLAMWGR